MKLVLQKDKVAIFKKVLIFLVITLAILHIGGYLLSIHIELKLIDQVAAFFDLDNEFNFPTFYTSFLLTVIACLNVIYLSMATHPRSKMMFGILGILFFVLALDETLVLHERAAAPVREYLSISDVSSLYHAWVIPAVFAGIGIYELTRLIKRKDRTSKFQKKVIAYVVALVFGAVSLEVIGTKFYNTEIAYKLGPILLEELFETSMISFILYNYLKFLPSK